jgi:DNA-binding winged helix-turn-helix (wHTH) protein/tetratricopeptide (TPR) repeat protein
MKNEPTPRYYEFDGFRLDPHKRLLLRDGEPVRLKSKAFALLLVLLERRERVLEKDELMQAVWPDTTVEENNLTVHMSALRKALGETSAEPRYIVTIPGRGYRFAAEVSEVGSAQTELIVRQRTRASVMIEEEEDAETRIGSIAVLPFKMLGDAASDEYLGLGLADALITRFSQLRQMLVRPTSAVARYAVSAQEPVVAGRELEVEALLEGRVQRVGERLRVTVQLIRVRDSMMLWGGKFDEPWQDIFAIQDSISEQVVRALMLSLSGEQQRRLNKRHTENPEAYRLYLKGRWHWSRFTEAGMKSGMECYRQAIELDPNYALAYTGLADAYGTLHYNGYLPLEEAAPRHVALAEKALQLDATLAEAHCSMAFAAIVYERDWARAEQEYKLATQLNPGYATAHHYYAFFLAAQARFDEALVEINHARAIDPLSPYLNTDVGWMHYFARRYDQALEYYQQALEIEPNFALAHAYRGLAYERLGRHEEAIAALQKAVTLAGGGADMTAWLGYVYAISGRLEEAQRVLQELQARAAQSYVALHNTAMIYAALGERDQAFAWLEDAFQKHAGWLFCLKVDARLDGLRDDPRFAELVRRFGLTQ